TSAAHPWGAIRTVADPAARANSDGPPASPQVSGIVRLAVHSGHVLRALGRRPGRVARPVTCGRTSHFVAQQVSVILRCRSKIVELASEYDRTGRNPHTCSVGRRHRVGRGADRRLDPRRDLARAAAGPPAGGGGTGPA